MKRTIAKAAASLVSLAMLLSTALGLTAKAAAAAVWPLSPDHQTITTYFDERRNTTGSSGYHNAVDIDAPNGAEIYAAYGGTCISAEWKDDYGNLVILYHPDLGVYTFYAHCSKLITYAGATVSQGDVIALVGSTGQSSGDHLHFGICDSLLGGWPSTIYYDPLTYFSYSDSSAPLPDSSSCSCTTDYAGVYTTKNVTTYLNIRSGHGTNYASIGQIPAGAEVIVTKSDGKWAHVLYNGISGFSSLDYLKKASEAASGMSLTGGTFPTGTLKEGSSFLVKGNISSSLPITRVWGGVYNSDGTTTEQYAVVEPNSNKYDLSVYFDNHLIFNALPSGSYSYRIEAEDCAGERFLLANSSFSIGDPETITVGDINGDGDVNISDAVILQSYLIGCCEFSQRQYLASDLNNDHVVDVFDFIIAKQKLAQN